MIERFLIGLVIACAVALLAVRARALSSTGAAAATLIGALAVAAGWDWGALLLLYFVASSALSRASDHPTDTAAAAARQASGIVEKGGARDAMQVAANGGVFALAALVHGAHPSAGAMAFGAGALAASAADTWGTEIGTRYGGTPWSLRTLGAAPAGTSGAVSLAGSIATLVGAAFVAFVAGALGWDVSICSSALVGGVAGAAADTVLGATMQAERYCVACASATERAVHDCGAATTHARGLAWMTNDAVNAAATVVGGVLAWLCAR